MLVILLKKLHERYAFPNKYANENGRGNAVNNFVITKMRNAFRSWRSRVKALIEKEATAEEILKKERANKEDLNIFRGRLRLAAHMEMSK